MHRTADIVKQDLPALSQQTAVVQPQISAVRAVLPPVPQATNLTADVLPPFSPLRQNLIQDLPRKPGWSRYRTARRDYRLFHADGRLRAVQVIAVNDGSISSSELKQILRDLAGKEQYQSGRQERKGGVWLERATLPGQADLPILSLNFKWSDKGCCVCALHYEGFSLI